MQNNDNISTIVVGIAVLAFFMLGGLYFWTEKVKHKNNNIEQHTTKKKKFNSEYDFKDNINKKYKNILNNKELYEIFLAYSFNETKTFNEELQELEIKINFDFAENIKNEKQFIKGFVVFTFDNQTRLVKCFLKKTTNEKHVNFNKKTIFIYDDESDTKYSIKQTVMDENNKITNSEVLQNKSSFSALEYILHNIKTQDIRNILF